MQTFVVELSPTGLTFVCRITNHHGTLEILYNHPCPTTTTLSLSTHLSFSSSIDISPILTITMSAPKSGRAWILSNPPTDMPDDSTFKLVEQDLNELKDGEVLVKTTYLSNDPAQRGWIQKGVIA